MARRTYSPTVEYSYKIDQDWWVNFSKNFENIPGFDNEGYDEYGYDQNGRDRAWKRERDYLADKDLYNQIKQDYQFFIR